MSTKKKKIDLQVGAFLEAWSGRGWSSENLPNPAFHPPVGHLKLADKPTPGIASIWLSAFFFIL